MKKILALVLALVMVAALCACGQAAAPAPASSGSAPASSDAAPAPADAAPAEEPAAESAVTTSTIGNGPVVINLYSFTDEVPKMVARYAELHPELANKYTFKVTLQATTDGGYQIMLDQALATGGADAPDIYCAESEIGRASCRERV